MICPIRFGEEQEQFEIIDNIDDIKTGLYAVSNYGRMYNVKTGRFKVATKDRKGYYYFTVAKNEPNTQKHLYVHRAVAHKFIKKGNDNQNIVNHMDGNRENNLYYNLEYCTLSENSIHAVKMGLSPTGERHKESVYSDKLTHDVCKCLERQLSTDEIIHSINLDTNININNFKKFIRDVKNKRSRKQISNLYCF